VHEQPGKEGGWYSVLIIAKFSSDVGDKDIFCVGLLASIDSIAVCNKSSRLASVTCCVHCRRRIKHKRLSGAVGIYGIL